MVKRNLHYIFLVLLFIDTGYSFIQHYNAVLDGDIANNILPAPISKQVFADPLGLSALLEHKHYSGPNRFFAYWFMSGYLKFAPLALQNFVDPIDSIYLACAIVKTFIQVFIIYLLAVAISKRGNIFKREFALAAVLIVPLFQTSGYNRYMGIIDPSVTYFFFYAVPISLLLFFFLLLYREQNHNIPMPFAVKLLLLVLIIILSLNGPLIPGIVLIACPLVLVMYWQRSLRAPDQPKVFYAIKNIPSNILFFFSFFCLTCLYSLYVGTFNSENTVYPFSIQERYMRLPAGLYYLFTQKLGLSLLTFMIFMNVFLIKKFDSIETKKIITFLKWIAVFCIIYTALLPLGGYRIYRPNIIRYDTMIPVIICMIFSYSYSTYFLLKYLQVKTIRKKIYTGGIVLVSLIFTIADKPVTGQNICEREALEQIAQSEEKIVHLTSGCTVMAWQKITDYHDSEANAELLQYWGVTKEKKLYYQD